MLCPMKPNKAIYRQTLPEKFDGKKWTYKTVEYEVIVMAVVGKHAMVRRPRCLPFVVDVKSLFSQKP